MGKRKRDGDNIIVIDSDSTTPEKSGDKPSIRRSQRNRENKMQGKVIDISRSQEAKIIPCSRTRKWRTRLRDKKSTKKLDSRTFDFHLENMWRDFPEDKKKLFTYFDSLWFSIYMSESSRKNMLTWVKDKEIFSKKYILVPIVYWNHWSLLIFCSFGGNLKSEDEPPCMLLLDSLEMAGPKRLEPAIRKFVLDIYRSEGRPESKKSIDQIPLLVPKVPQQRNGEECGKYVLYFINLFVEQVTEQDLSVKKYPDFMTEEWFNLDDLKDFSDKLKPPEIENLPEN